MLQISDKYLYPSYCVSSLHPVNRVKLILHIRTHTCFVTATATATYSSEETQNTAITQTTTVSTETDVIVSKTTTSSTETDSFKTSQTVIASTESDVLYSTTTTTTTGVAPAKRTPSSAVYAFPTYASACSSFAAYSSACANCLGVTGTIITVDAPSTTVQVTVISTSTTSSIQTLVLTETDIESATATTSTTTTSISSALFTESTTRTEFISVTATTLTTSVAVSTQIVAPPAPLTCAASGFKLIVVGGLYNGFQLRYVGNGLWAINPTSGYTFKIDSNGNLYTPGEGNTKSFWFPKSGTVVYAPLYAYTVSPGATYLQPVCSLITGSLGYQTLSCTTVQGYTAFYDCDGYIYMGNNAPCQATPLKAVCV